MNLKKGNIMGESQRPGLPETKPGGKEPGKKKKKKRGIEIMEMLGPESFSEKNQGQSNSGQRRKKEVKKRKGKRTKTYKEPLGQGAQKESFLRRKFFPEDEPRKGKNSRT